MARVSLWPRLDSTARAFVAWLLCCCAAPTVGAVLYELVNGETALTRAAPWIGVLVDIASVLFVVRPSGGPRSWMPQVRQWLERHSAPSAPVQPGASAPINPRSR